MCLSAIHLSGILLVGHYKHHFRFFRKVLREKCPGLGLDNIEEVARMDEHIGFFSYNDIDRRQEIVIDLLFAEVHPALGIEEIECCEAKVGVGDVDEVHCV